MNDIFIVPLTNSDRLCIVDFEDRDRVMKFKWIVDNRYIRSTHRKGIFLHHHIKGVKRKIDHKNRFTGDNRKLNLRFASSSQNAINTKIYKSNTSGYKGVCLNKKNGNYVAYISRKGNRIHLGSFESSVDAALAYNIKALELFGNFANLNIL
jgi:hypothetical protein